jgi:hypothetical protein
MKHKKTAKSNKSKKSKKLIFFFDLFYFAVKNSFINIHSLVLDTILIRMITHQMLWHDPVKR